MPLNCQCYLEEAFTILEHEDTTIGEVGLLRHPGRASLDGVLVELAVPFDFRVVLALQIVTEGGDNTRTAPRRQGIENQNAGSGNKEIRHVTVGQLAQLVWNNDSVTN